MIHPAREEKSEGTLELLRNSAKRSGIRIHLSNRAFFRAYVASSKQEGAGRIPDGSANPRHSSGFVELLRILPILRVFR